MEEKEEGKRERERGRKRGRNLRRGSAIPTRKRSGRTERKSETRGRKLDARVQAVPGSWNTVYNEEPLFLR